MLKSVLAVMLSAVLAVPALARAEGRTSARDRHPHRPLWIHKCETRAEQIRIPTASRRQFVRQCTAGYRINSTPDSQLKASR